jgi:hypothetical protein
MTAVLIGFYNSENDQGGHSKAESASAKPVSFPLSAAADSSAETP